MASSSMSWICWSTASSSRSTRWMRWRRHTPTSSVCGKKRSMPPRKRRTMRTRLLNRSRRLRNFRSVSMPCLWMTAVTHRHRRSSWKRRCLTSRRSLQIPRRTMRVTRKRTPWIVCRRNTRSRKMTRSLSLKKQSRLIRSCTIWLSAISTRTGGRSTRNWSTGTMSMGACWTLKSLTHGLSVRRRHSDTVHLCRQCLPGWKLR